MSSSEDYVNVYSPESYDEFASTILIEDSSDSMEMCYNANYKNNSEEHIREFITAEKRNYQDIEEYLYNNNLITINSSILSNPSSKRQKLDESINYDTLPDLVVMKIFSKLKENVRRFLRLRHTCKRYMNLSSNVVHKLEIDSRKINKVNDFIQFAALQNNAQCNLKIADNYIRYSDMSNAYAYLDTYFKKGGAPFPGVSGIMVIGLGDVLVENTLIPTIIYICDTDYIPCYHIRMWMQNGDNILLKNIQKSDVFNIIRPEFKILTQQFVKDNLIINRSASTRCNSDRSGNLNEFFIDHPYVRIDDDMHKLFRKYYFLYMTM